MGIGHSRIIKSDERAYMIARALVVVVLGGAGALGVARLDHALDPLHFYGAIAGFTVVGAIQAYAHWVHHVDLRHTMLVALPFDVVLIGALSASLTETGDLGFAVAIAWPVLYALVLRRREAWIVGGLTAAVYELGSMSAVSDGRVNVVEVAIKAAVIVLVGGRVAYSEQVRRVREEEIERTNAENERLNSELHTSLSDLRALFELTDHIHASLDFDLVIGPVLGTIAGALQLDTCALFVLDNTDGAVIASAALNLPLDLVLPPDPECETRWDDAVFEEPLSCFCPFEQPHLRLVFCARSADIELLSENDHMLLQAMGHEVAIAIDNSQLYKLTKRMAIVDELTGLHNYRYLQRSIDDEVMRAQRYSGFCSLLMIDTDDFKAYNDAYGHVAGDQALKELGEVLTANVRATDLVARYGGEEFSVLLPETDTMGALATAEKLRQAVAAFSFQEPYDRHLSVSIGIASYPAHGIDAESVLRAADDALYVAKNSGKNQVRVPGVCAVPESVVGI